MLLLSRIAIRTDLSSMKRILLPSFANRRLAAVGNKNEGFHNLKFGSDLHVILKQLYKVKPITPFYVRLETLQLLSKISFLNPIILRY